MSSDFSLLTPFNFERLKKGRCLLSVPAVQEIFYTICANGSSNISSSGTFQPFAHDEKKCISYGGIVLVTSDLKRDDDDVSHVRQMLSASMPFRYDSFDRKKDDAETLKGKVNDFIKHVVLAEGKERPSQGWLSERSKEDYPKFSKNVDVNKLNLLLVAFFDVRLNWWYMDISRVRDFVFNGKPRQAFCIPNVQAGARLYTAKSHTAEHYLVVRLPVNRINSHHLVSDEKDEVSKDPWGNLAFLDDISDNVMYLSLCIRVDFDETKLKTLNNGRKVYEVDDSKGRSRYMYAEPVNPEKVDVKELCHWGETFLLDSLDRRMPKNRTTVTMPKVETSLSFTSNAENADEWKILSKTMFWLPMDRFAHKTEGRNTSIDEIALDTKIGIDENGVTVSAMMGGICTDSYSSHIPYTVQVDGPFCYTLSLGRRVIAIGLEQ